MAQTCVVCFDNFNKSSRCPTKCSYCETEICRTCLQTYLLNDINDTPNCVNPECGHGMDREFLDAQLTKSFRLTTYKEHREKVLSDRERSRLPLTQEDAAEYRNAKVQYETTSQKLRTLREKLVELRQQESEYERKLWRARNVIDTYGRTRLVRPGESTIEHQPPKEKAAFIKPCPAENCKGFLSTAWKCGLCEKWTCPDCHELKGLNKDVEHTCDPEKIATAQLLAREAKSCPKCGVQICKIEGCDQMWCTQCNTGFNWRTGKLASGPVHNPHYFEYLRRQGVNPAERPAGVRNCEYDMDRTISRALGNVTFGRRVYNGTTQNSTELYLQEIWRLSREAQDPDNNRIPNSDENLRQMRVRYMVGELTEADWKIALQKSEKDSNYRMAVGQVNEVFANASRDIVRQVLQENHDKSAIRKQIEELVEYCNDSYKVITKRFNRKTPLIKVQNGKQTTESRDQPVSLPSLEPIEVNRIVSDIQPEM